MSGKIVYFDKLKGYLTDSYAFLWVILFIAIAIVPLTGVVLVTKIAGSQARAALGSSVAACTFSPASVDVGKSIVVTSNRGNVFGQITIQGAYLTTAVPVGTLAKRSSVAVVIPPVASGLYVVRVGSPAVNCKTTTGGDLAIQNVVPSPIPTPVTVGASNLIIVNQTCTTSGSVNVSFHWTPQPDGAWFKKGAQWLDLSMTGTFDTGNYVSHNVFGFDSYMTSTAAGNIGPLVPGAGYFWRINTLNALNSSWYPSTTAKFVAINCTIASPAPTPPALTAACSITPSSIKPGGSVSVVGRGFVGLTYSANLLGTTTTQFYDLGLFNGTTGTYVVPQTVSPGAYTVRIFSGNTADNGVVCTPNLMVY